VARRGDSSWNPSVFHGHRPIPVRPCRGMLPVLRLARSHRAVPVYYSWVSSSFQRSERTSPTVSSRRLNKVLCRGRVPGAHPETADTQRRFQESLRPTTPTTCGACIMLRRSVLASCAQGAVTYANTFGAECRSQEQLHLAEVLPLHYVPLRMTRSVRPRPTRHASW